MAKFKVDSLNGELIHFNATRMRVNGSGSLKQTLYSLDDVNNSTLPNITLAASTNKEPTVLVNFVEQRGYLDLRTESINEWFIISKIVIFVKPVSTGYPQ